MSKITKSFDVYGMHCKSCETAIEEEIKSLNGIFNVQASHNKSNVITVYENEILSENEIKKAIKKAGYSTYKKLYKPVFMLRIDGNYNAISK